MIEKTKTCLIQEIDRLVAENKRLWEQVDRAMEAVGQVCPHEVCPEPPEIDLEQGCKACWWLYVKEGK